MNTAAAKAGFIAHNETDSKKFISGITVVSIILGTIFTLKQLQRTRAEEQASAVKIGILEDELKDVKAQLNQQGLDIV
tara:strand:- start:480 stop:713 length:234 start_codon:yes stop_codon:yes gene_type:complete